MSRLAGINLNLLVALDALLATRNVTEAAKQIGVTQPAMSHSLAKLRELFEDRLLVRSPEGLIRTPLADRLRPALAQSLGDLERALFTRDGFDAKTAKHTFSIATADFMAAILGPKLAPTLRATASVDVRFARLDVGRMADDLREATLDLAVGPRLRVASDIGSRDFGQEPFVCAMRTEHPRAPATRLSLARFASLAHVQVSPTGRGVSALDSALHKAGRSRRVVLRTPSFLEAMAIAADSDLVVSLPKAALTSSPFRDVLRYYSLPIEVPPLAFAVYWYAPRQDDARLQWIRRALAPVATSTANLRP